MPWKTLWESEPELQTCRNSNLTANLPPGSATDVRVVVWRACLWGLYCAFRCAEWMNIIFDLWLGAICHLIHAKWYFTRWPEHSGWAPDCHLQYLPLLQSDLALLLTADERPVAPEHSVSSKHQMCKGCWEETDPVFNYTLEKNNIKWAHVLVSFKLT